MNAPRSGCPINLTLEALGDRWSLIVIRDLMFGNRRHFRELLTRSEERIASNILVMDEPFGALDALTREHMQEELLKIWRTSKPTVILVTTASRRRSTWARARWSFPPAPAAWSPTSAPASRWRAATAAP